LTPQGRLRLVERCQYRPIAHVAAEAGVARQTVTKWARRYAELGEAGLVDRSSAPHSSPTQIPGEVVERIEDLRRTHKWTARQIHLELVREGHQIAPVTVARWLRRLGISRRRDIDPSGASNRVIKRIVARYPGHMVHLDVKKVGRIPDGGGWRAHGRGSDQAKAANRAKAKGARAGYVYLHSAVDGFSRLAYTEVLPNETAATTIGFWARARVFFAAHGIHRVTRVVTDNGSNYRAKDFNRAILASAARHQRIRPHTPKHNGKVERYNRTISEELLYAREWTSESQRAEAIKVWNIHYNYHRAHTAAGNQPPASRLHASVTNVMTQNSRCQEGGTASTPNSRYFLARHGESEVEGMASSSPSPAPGSTQGLRTGMILAIVLVSYFMIVLDNSIIFTGLPQIQASLNLSPGGLAWAQNAYTLVFGGLLLLGARMGDLLGRRRVFIVGLALFGLASFLIGTAQNEAWIIAARAFQGIGAAIVAPSSLALITALFPAGPERTRATAAYGTTAGLGASLGLVVGGALADWISWRAGFFINVPIAIVMIILALKFLPTFDTIRGQFDFTGAITSTLGMGAFVYGIINAGERSWTDPLTFWPIIAGLLVLVGFVVNEWKAKQPIMPLRLFASRQRSGAAIARLLFAGTMIAFFFFTTQLFQGVYGWTPLQAGLGFLPMTIVQFASSLLVSRLTHRFGSAPLLVVGLALVTGGMAWMTQITAQTPFLIGAVGSLILLGLGQGIAFGPLTSAGVAGAHPEDAGAASGLVNTAHQLGSTLGVAILTAVATGAATLEQRVVDAYIGGTILVGIAALTALALILPAELKQRRQLRSALPDHRPT
jgi:EmrB/QacA subfamily drug resistance transporter